MNSSSNSKIPQLATYHAEASESLATYMGFTYGKIPTNWWKTITIWSISYWIWLQIHKLNTRIPLSMEQPILPWIVMYPPYSNIHSRTFLAATRIHRKATVDETVEKPGKYDPPSTRTIIIWNCDRVLQVRYRETAVMWRLGNRWGDGMCVKTWISIDHALRSPI